MCTDTITKPTGVDTAVQGRWRLDPTRSSVEFRTPTFWGRATVDGRFERAEGSLDLRRTPAIDLTIDADSLTTNNRLRDRHLRSADFFNVEEHPQVRFVSDVVRVDGDRLKVRGRLHAAGASLALEFDASLRRVGGELEIDATTSADHRQLGMSSGTFGMIPPHSELHVHARLVR
jgi:polyisoprenoid-binding protein YceI